MYYSWDKGASFVQFVFLLVLFTYRTGNSQNGVIYYQNKKMEDP